MRWLTGRKLTILILTVIVLFLVAGLSKPKNPKSAGVLSTIINVPLAPIQELFMSIENGLKDRFTYLGDMSKLKEENDNLKAQLDQYEKFALENESLLLQNAEYRAALNLRDRYRDMDLEGANILNWDSGRWYDLFTVDKGSSDGIRNNGNDRNSDYSSYSTVVTGAGLVGRVVETGLLTSKVMSIISQDSIVSGILTKSRQYVDVVGSVYYQQEGLCLIQNIGSDVVIEEGDAIETSGVGGNYPKGIIIGTVAKVVQDENSTNRYAILKPAVDFKKLETVYILVNKDE